MKCLDSLNAQTSAVGLVTMIAFPAAVAAATFIANMINDIFHGMMAATTPYGCLIVMLIIPGVLKLHCPSMW